MGEEYSAGLFYRDMGSNAQRHEAGWKVEGHSHRFDHATWIRNGKYRVVVRQPITLADGTQVTEPNGNPLFSTLADRVFEAGDVVPILRECWHEITCIEGPGRIACVFPARDPITEQPMDRWNGWMQAFM